MIWLLLTGSLAWDELLAGLFASMLTAWIAQKHLMILDDIRWSVSMPFYLAQFLAQFCFALLLANLDMARRILSPSLPINPALVEVETRLQSPLGKLMLANSITLTPGTLTVDIEAQHLLVHWVDSSSGTDLPHATAIIARRFEHSLAALFY
ncbi:Na+/H+ antiporter subunit E [Candidatus Venteria ishoeyi]|nr:Na+/H+ antiporter subunit E [Candidatus Venteria ishoeyi]SEH04158.1 Na(+)/H(+) antiporter subunit E1 [Candidatus Venteria ishoeyi]